MPPKASARGRGGARGRGTGRAAARPAEAEAEAAPEAPAVPVVKRDDEDEDSKPSTTAEHTPAPVEQQIPADRPPAQRLGSLNASRSASPAVRRGAATRGKKGPIKPTFTGRRSKEERAALEKEALDREKARNAEHQRREEQRLRRMEEAKKREANRALRGRGGYSGAMSGPFSMGSSREDRKANHRTTSTFAPASGSRATRIKDEHGEPGAGGGGYGGGGGGSSSSTAYRPFGGSSARRPETGQESDEDDEDAAFPRKDIDLIEISSDEGEAPPTYRPSRTALPVRIGRKEHKEAAFGINTDASTEASAKTLEQAEAAGRAPTASGLKHASSKGKGKARQADTAPATKAFKGVWQDPDELASPVKTESDSADEAMLDAQHINLAAQAAQDIELHDPPAETHRRARPRARFHPEPAMQNEQERDEWQRFQNNLRHIRAELGPAAADDEPDVPMADDGARKPTVRDNNVYLFQIPPLMPRLSVPGMRKDASSDNPTPAIKLENPPPPPPPPSPYPSGLVGKLRVHASGRTTLDWGGTAYELGAGNKASFLQEVVSLTLVEERDRVVMEDAGEAVSFGRVKGRFVVRPGWGGLLG